MSSGEDLDIWYYSSVLARSLKKDDNNFDRFYKLICSISSVHKADRAKELAFQFSDHPLAFLSHRVNLMEKGGMEPLQLPDIENSDEVNSDELMEQNLTVHKSAATVQLITSSVDEDLIEKDVKMSSMHPASRVEQFIDDDDADEVNSEPRSSPLSSATSVDRPSALKNNEKFNEQCAIEMVDIPIGQSGYLKNYDTAEKTYFTADDYMREQHNKTNFEELTSVSGNLSISKFALANADELAVNDDNQKALKKKKRFKEKKNQDLPVENSNVCLLKDGERYVSHANSSETQPLLDNDCGSRSAMSSSSHKSKKVGKQSSSVKRYGSDDKAMLSKAAYRKQVEQEKLSDEALQEILEKCGDPAGDISQSKKKSKENKHSSVKKDKKKLKKQKKGEKKKAPEPNEISDTEESDVSPKPSVVEATAEDFAEASPTPMDIDEEEFVTQRRKKTLHKHPASGRNSPHKFETVRKRRYSDPSPAVPDNPAPSNENQASNGKEKQKTEHKSWVQNGTYREASNVQTQNEVYDRTVHAQWPTLSSQGDSSSTRNPAAQPADSYASKLKSNLDSTGCSLASSSEDSSSSSSSTNNYQVCPGDRASPVHSYATTLSDISRTIHAAAGFVNDKLEQTSLQGNPHIEMLHPVNAASKVENMQIKSASNVMKLKNENLRNATQNEVVQSIDQSKNEAVIPPQTTMSSTNKIKVKATEKGKLQSTSDAQKPTPALLEPKKPSNVLNELENKFGLTFIIDDISNLNREAPAIPDTPLPFNVTDVQVTFGDGNVYLDELSRVTKQDKAGPSATQIPQLTFEMRLTEKLSAWNYNVGNFDMKKATFTLFQEWKKALEKGTYYKDLNKQM